MKILFVCTGNTCRSPLAQAIATLEGEAAGIGLSCESAGLSACEGEAVSEYSADAVKKLYGREFSHFARQVTPRLVEESDLIFGMTRTHTAMLKQAFPLAAEKIRCFPTEISDPYGGSREQYERAALRIREGIRGLMEEGVIHA